MQKNMLFRQFDTMKLFRISLFNIFSDRLNRILNDCEVAEVLEATFFSSEVHFDSAQCTAFESLKGLPAYREFLFFKTLNNFNDCTLVLQVVKYKKLMEKYNFLCYEYLTMTLPYFNLPSKKHAKNIYFIF